MRPQPLYRLSYIYSGFDLGTIYLTSSPAPQCRLECLLICGKCRAGEASVPFWVLVGMWAVPTQLCSQYGKRRWLSCTTAAPCGPFGAQPSASGNLIASRQAHFSPITRLPSGSSTSHSGVFRDGVLGVGVGTAHPCTGALAIFVASPLRATPCGPFWVRSAQAT